MKKMRSAKQVRTVNNILVHTALAILAPVGDTYQLPCGEGVLCVHIFPEGIYTG